MCASAVLPRIIGRGLRNIEGARGLRWRGTEEEGAFARPERPRRCTLPITALRVIPPSSAAIWLAERPSVHNFLRSSTRSSVQLILNVLGKRSSGASAESGYGPGQQLVAPTHTPATDLR